MNNTPNAPDEIALRIAHHLCDTAPISRTLGIEVLDASTMHCRIQMIVRTHMLNALSIAHGGVLFAFADTALAYLANNTNARAVTQTAHVMFLAPAADGDTLTATASILHRTSRNISMNVRVTNSEHKHLVEAQGVAHVVNGVVLPS